MRATLHAMLFVLVASFIPAALSAQSYATDQGSVIIGGSASFMSEGGDLNGGGDRTNTLSLNPYVLYFVSPGFGIGGDLTATRVSQGDTHVSVVGIGPTVAYFFGDADATTRPFVEGNVSYASSTFDNGAGSETASGFGLGGGVGAAFMLSPTVALTAEATYNWERLSSSGVHLDGNRFGLALGIAAFLF